MKTAKEYRAQALEVLRGNWKPYVLSSLILLAVAVLFMLPIQVGGPLEAPVSFILTATAGMYLGYFLLCMPLNYGFMNGTVAKLRGEEGSILDKMLQLFKQEYGRGIGSFLLIVVFGALIAIPLVVLAVLVTLVIVVAALDIPVAELAQWLEAEQDTFAAIFMVCYVVALIPLVVWTFAVYLTVYLAHDRKDLGLRACMKESKRLMKGHKWQLFCLCMSFIGWAFLGVLTLGVGILWVMPYQQMAISAFYEDVVKEDAAKAA